MWLWILNAGKEVEGEARIKGNMLVENCSLAPPLYALRKDHKHHTALLKVFQSDQYVERCQPIAENVPT